MKLTAEASTEHHCSYPISSMLAACLTPEKVLCGWALPSDTTRCQGLGVIPAESLSLLVRTSRDPLAVQFVVGSTALIG